jgi:hypothetical protein
MAVGVTPDPCRVNELFTWTGFVQVTAYGCGMKDNKGKRKQVILEPALEAFAGELDWRQRLELGAQFARWARQLRVSGKLLQPRPSGPRRRRLPPWSASQVKLN